MIKTLIIALQFFIIVFGVLFGWNWARLYQHRTEQLFYVNHLRIMANDIRFLTTLKNQIDSGKDEQAKDEISTAVSGIVEEMEEHIDQRVDPNVTDTFATAREAGASLDKIGIHRISAAIDRRAKSIEK